MALATSFQISADTTESAKIRGVGLALAMPSVGVSLKSVLSERRTVSVVIGSGIQAQLNFTGNSPNGGYYLLGAGRNDLVGLVRLGYGYVWNKNNFSYHVEAGLNLPVWSRELGGLAEIGKFFYLIPIGFGVHYNF